MATFFSNQSVRLVLRVVSVSHAAIRPEFKLKELMSEFALVAHTIVSMDNGVLIADVEIVASHFAGFH